MDYYLILKIKESIDYDVYRDFGCCGYLFELSPFLLIKLERLDYCLPLDARIDSRIRLILGFRFSKPNMLPG